MPTPTSASRLAAPGRERAGQNRAPPAVPRCSRTSRRKTTTMSHHGDDGHERREPRPCFGLGGLIDSKLGSVLMRRGGGPGRRLELTPLSRASRPFPERPLETLSRTRRSVTCAPGLCGTNHLSSLHPSHYQSHRTSRDARGKPAGQISHKCCINDDKGKLVTIAPCRMSVAFRRMPIERTSSGR